LLQSSINLFPFQLATTTITESNTIISPAQTSPLIHHGFTHSSHASNSAESSHREPNLQFKTITKYHILCPVLTNSKPAAPCSAHQQAFTASLPHVASTKPKNHHFSASPSNHQINQSI
jgi:hypothetical protein